MAYLISAIDLFCGIGGLSYGLKQAGIPVAVGVDLDESCQYAFEENVGGKFVSSDISDMTGNYLEEYYSSDKEAIKILVGCAPCQPFSSHANKYKNKSKNKKWGLLHEFGRLISELQPSIVSMENVTNLINKDVFKDFLDLLNRENYEEWHASVYCPNYGIPQKRRRLVLLASRLGSIELLPPSHDPSNYRTVKDAIGDLPKLEAGESDKYDSLHRSRSLSKTNIKRIKASLPNGTWEDWDETLLLECHKKKTGKTYKSVYGRMAWDEPSSTITTQFYNYGTGRFGHPTQDRALSIREGAILQTFPKDYKLLQDENSFSMNRLGRQIGNAVPVDLGEVIGKSILAHLEGAEDDKL